MRYFLVYYTANYGKKLSDGSIWGAFDKFPSRSELKKYINEKFDHYKDNIIIANIFEFKSKEDYEAFNE